MRDRAQALVCLAAGGALLAVANGRWVIPLAAWLAPIFVMRFVRTQPLVLAALLPTALMGGVAFFSWHGVAPAGGGGAIAPVLGSAAGIVPYLVDRFVTRRVAGVAATLVFPAAWTTFEYANASLSPLGTFGSVAYTQYGNLPLLQVLSVGGLWAVTFLVMWAAPVANDLWERRRAAPATAVFAGVLVTVLVFGGARLALSQSGHEAVAVGGVTLPGAPAADVEAYAEPTRRLARAGAKLVVWRELAIETFEAVEPDLIAGAKRLARDAGIHLQIAYWSRLDSGEPGRNTTVLVGPDGSVGTPYLKRHPVPGDPDVRGRLDPPIAETPIGRVAAAICFDFDFPPVARAIGRRGADIVLLPSKDWAAIDPLHARMAVFRALENGFALVRPAEEGLSLAVDRYGRELAAVHERDSADGLLLAQVPVAGGPTVYARVGDAFAWVTALIVALALALAARSKALSSRGPRDVPALP